MLVYTVYGKTVEHVEWSHPLRVTLGKIVVDGNDMNTIACEGIQEYGECGYEGLSLTSCHLGDFSLMQYYTAEELHVVVYHVPLEVIASGCPVVVVYGLVSVNCYKVVLRVCCQLTVEVGCRNYSFLVLGKSSCSVLDDTERCWHNLVKSLLVDVEHLFVELVDLVEYLLPFIDRGVFDSCLEFFYLGFLLLCRILHISLYLLSLGSQLVVAQFLNIGINSLDFLYQRLDQFHVPA